VVRYIGMDVHREFAQLAVVEDGLVRDEGRIGVTPEALRAWAAGLRADDHVALEATGNSDAIANLLTPLVARVVVSNPSKTPGDRRGEGEDRQGRCADPGAAAGRRLPAAGVAAR
jgi:transposase